MVGRIEEFSNTHLDQFEIRPVDTNAFKTVDDWKKTICVLMSQGYSSSLIVDDKVLIVANLRLLWKGVGEIWVLTSTTAANYPILICKLSRSWLDNRISELQLHRVQGKVIAGFKEAHAWARWFKFNPEAYMKQYGPSKEDYVQYARII